MKGRKTISLSAESSKPAEGGGILTGENSVGAMHPLDSPVNAQVPSERLQLAAEGENKRPRFEEGFYELEAIRKKRMRQGKVQYLIKWRGWPESANTWEPHENLSSCPDVVAAFERRSRAHSGKRSKRGRKRKLSATLTRIEMGLHHSAAAAKVTPQTKTRRRQHASAPAAEDTMGIETRNMPCHSSAAAKDNVPATKGIPLVAVPFPCLDDSSIEIHVRNDVCRPKVSGSSRVRNEHPLITNRSSLEKSVADSEETQILGACFPPGFSKSNIGKPVRSAPRAQNPRAPSPAMANARIARFITEAAPPQFVTVMRRRRAAKMLDPIKEEESSREASFTNALSPKIATDTTPPSCSAKYSSSASFLSASAAAAKPKFFFKDDAAAAAARRPSSSSVIFGN